MGHGDGTEAVVVRGDRDAREFIAFWHRNGIVTAAMNVNTWDVVDDLRSTVEAHTSVEPARLADPDVPLSELVR